MLRSLLARLGLTHGGDQLELPLDAPADQLLARLRRHGLRGIDALHLTRNRRVLVSHRAGTLRVHEGFATAPDTVQRAIARFVSGRGAERRSARAIILAHPVVPVVPEALEGLAAPAAPRRRHAMHPDDHALAARLQREHARLNGEHFGGALGAVRLTISRRMRSRLGHYAPARSHPDGAEIAISRRHIRRHGWREATHTLLHEMVHQWQEEQGHAIDHGPTFRAKAREVGVMPRSRRALP